MLDVVSEEVEEVLAVVSEVDEEVLDVVSEEVEELAVDCWLSLDVLDRVVALAVLVLSDVVASSPSSSASLPSDVIRGIAAAARAELTIPPTFVGPRIAVAGICALVSARYTAMMRLATIRNADVARLLGAISIFDGEENGPIVGGRFALQECVSSATPASPLDTLRR